MANKNKNLIVAFYPSADKASMAADLLKEWDHNNDDVKLGGMGIITYYDDKLHTVKVGARAGGTGAKWGTILGATGGLMAGILTGGIGLIPGAIVGLGAGGLGGSLFHKKVGLTDSDKAMLEDHLKDGGAAIGVMADDLEVEPTKKELFELGGKVEHYTVPDATLAALEGASHALHDEAPHHDADEQAAVDDSPAMTAEDVDFYNAHQVSVRASALMAACRGLNEENAAALEDAGVHTVEDLLNSAATPENRRELSSTTGIPESDILAWAKDLDLSRIHGVGILYADLLEHAGVDTVPELAQRNPQNLVAKMAEINADQQIVHELPTEEAVADWVAEANQLPRLISY